MLLSSGNGRMRSGQIIDKFWKYTLQDLMRDKLWSVIQRERTGMIPGFLFWVAMRLELSLAIWETSWPVNILSVISLD